MKKIQWLQTSVRLICALGVFGMLGGACAVEGEPEESAVEAPFDMAEAAELDETGCTYSFVGYDYYWGSTAPDTATRKWYCADLYGCDSSAYTVSSATYKNTWPNGAKWRWSCNKNTCC